MAAIVRMPAVMANATEAVLSGWLVTPGQLLAAGSPLAEIETDKATVEYSTEVAGVVGRLLATAGDTLAVGAPIAVLLADHEGEADIDAALRDAGVPVGAFGDAAVVDSGVPAGAARVTTCDREAAQGGDGGRRLYASPLARRLAAERGIDLATVAGHGPNGRITRRDLEAAVAEATVTAVAETTAVAEATVTEAPVTPVAPGSALAPKPIAPAASMSEFPAPMTPSQPAEYVDEPATRMRQAIARRLAESKATVPHFYLKADVKVDALLALRRDLNAALAAVGGGGTGGSGVTGGSGEAKNPVSVNDLLLAAVARALVAVPEANAIWLEDAIRRFSRADIAIAIAIDGGLVTPVLRGVETMPVPTIGVRVRDLASRARAGRLGQNELEGGSFTVSNLGMYGVQEFAAIINPPHSGILAVGAARPKAVVGPDRTIGVATVMTVTLSADHRVIDGAVGARWLEAFVRLVENPLALLL